MAPNSTHPFFFFFSACERDEALKILFPHCTLPVWGRSVSDAVCRFTALVRTCILVCIEGTACLELVQIGIYLGSTWLSSPRYFAISQLRRSHSHRWAAHSEDQAGNVALVVGTQLSKHKKSQPGDRSLFMHGRP